MDHGNDGYIHSGWVKNFRNMRGTLHYERSREGSKKAAGMADVEKLSQKRLIRHFLCDGENSSCVLYHQCECLQACKYGQRYIQTLDECEP